jgi:hypothetical protein
MAMGSVAKNCGSIGAAAKLQRFLLVEAAAPYIPVPLNGAHPQLIY